MKILFATMPFDGHFNPLTGVAMSLQAAGHDIRWYAGPSYAVKVEKLGIHHYPFQRATEINQDNVGELFPERAKLRGPALIRFEARHIFVDNTENFFEDVREIEASFPFDALFCDSAFYAMKLIKEKLGKQVCAFEVGPSLETSKDVPPNFVGLKPAKNAIGRLIHQGMRAMMERMVMGESKVMYNRMLAAHGLAPIDGSLFDVSYRSPDVVFLSGVPGFTYPRRVPNPKVKFVGPLLPYKSVTSKTFSHAEKLGKYKQVILISQGTVDNKDPGKLIVPALEALKDKGVSVGGRYWLLEDRGSAKVFSTRQYHHRGFHRLRVHPELHGSVHMQWRLRERLTQPQQRGSAVDCWHPGRQERRQRTCGLLRSRY